MTVEHVQETPIKRINRELVEHFPLETAKLDRAAETFEAASAALLRPDGSKRYSDAEHQEQMTALLDKLDSVGATVTSAASAAIERAQADLAKLDGQDGWDALSVEERQRAATRQPFIAEDARDGRPDQIVTQAQAALAANDKAAVYLWARGIRRRVDTAHDQGQRVAPELLTALRELEARVVGDPTERRQKQQAIERRIESAKLLTGRVRSARSQADGSDARALAGYREYIRSRF